MSGRLVTMALGAGAIAWGLWELFVTTPSATRPLWAVIWLAASLVVHDALLAPLAVAIGFVAARILPRSVQRWWAMAALAGISLALIAAPPLLR